MINSSRAAYLRVTTKLSDLPRPSTSMHDLRDCHSDPRLAFRSYSQHLLAERVEELRFGFESAARCIGCFKNILGQRRECGYHLNLIDQILLLEPRAPGSLCRWIIAAHQLFRLTTAL